MPDSNIDISLKSLVEVTDAILKGDFNREDNIAIDAEGMLASLAQKINQMLVNMRKVESSLSNAGERTPFVVDNARNVMEMMSRSTEEVLSKSDMLTGIAEEFEPVLKGRTTANGESAQKRLEDMKVAVYDIIASQSYQDVARQQMESMSSELKRIRDWLIEALVVLNINKDDSPESIAKNRERLQEVKQSESKGTLDQDLVDDLLAEFGF